MTDKITILIPRDLKLKLEKKIKETNFKSIQEYILYILEQIVSDERVNNEKIAYTEKEEKEIRGDQAWYTEDGGKQAYTEEEEAALKKNLKDLGYL
ncbi:MAG: hypothetical protein KKF67_02690 [Nanoarchaeota archaeon]|nr:hypothetical protein [Nanoarchaeota archaeon]